ncbi:MAG: septum formation protein Maf [Chloroflexi bacterium]|nr:septum formation protein Maf [Chloroflexota bacterium]
MPGGDAGLLILASASPRRRRLLRYLGLPFSVVSPGEVEGAVAAGGMVPADAAEALARAKAAAVATGCGEGLVLAADTLVVRRNRSLGKPADAADARRMLRRLRDGEHLVITGVCLLEAGAGLSRTAYQLTRVWMRNYADAEIDRYVATGDSLDKAGAYAVQSREFRPVVRLAGCYTCVVGLPLCAVAALLAERGIHVPQVGERDAERCGYCQRARADEHL